jgi:ferredoxin-NADP reductase
VYTVWLRPDQPAPPFRPGQFLHLALDPYEPTGFWPESRVFSIASSPLCRDLLRVSYSARGQFTTRMEAELVEGRRVWTKMPYGNFVIDDERDVVLFAGGTGITAFTAFLEALADGAGRSERRPDRSIVIAYGARTSHLLIYRDLVERCLQEVTGAAAAYFVEESVQAAQGPTETAVLGGRVSVAAVWPLVPRPAAAHHYISGPPGMLAAISRDLRTAGIPQPAIHIDAWE